jgi:hypothetical protein
MELTGHPTQDILDELERRGASIIKGTQAGPDPQQLSGAREPGLWVFLSRQVFETGLDEEPPF